MTAAAPALEVVIRPMVDSDRAFVWETTLKVRKPHGTPWRTWRAARSGDMDAILCGSRVLVADAGGVVLGFLMTMASTVSMLYVKRAFRGDGLGLALLRSEAALKWHPALRVAEPNACWRRWAKLHRIEWEPA